MLCYGCGQQDCKTSIVTAFLQTSHNWGTVHKCTTFPWGLVNSQSHVHSHERCVPAHTRMYTHTHTQTHTHTHSPCTDSVHLLSKCRTFVQCSHPPFGPPSLQRGRADSREHYSGFLVRLLGCLLSQICRFLTWLGCTCLTSQTKLC